MITRARVHCVLQTLYRRALVTPSSPPLDFLLLVSILPEPSLRELEKVKLGIRQGKHCRE